MYSVRAPKLLGFIVGMGAGHIVQLALNNGQPLSGNDGIIGAILGGIAGAIIAHVIVKLRGQA